MHRYRLSSIVHRQTSLHLMQVRYIDFYERIALRMPGDETLVSFLHLFFRCFGEAPFGDFGGCSQSDVEIPIRQVCEIDWSQGSILLRETMHGVDSECPEHLEPTIGKIGEGIAYRRVLPVDDRHKLAILP